MADVRPVNFPDSVDAKPYRYGERLLHQASVGLPPSWYALYEVHWIGAQLNGPPEGECDFVFISPEVGLIVVEVKGGGVGRDADGWYSVDRHDERHRIKNPAAQAQTGRYALLRYLNQSGREHLLSAYSTSHMVCFPNIDKTSLPRLPELNPALIIDCNDIAHLAECLSAGSRAFHGDKLKPLSPEECRGLADALKPAFEVQSRWASHIFQQRFEIDRLTAEQQRAFAMLSSNKRISLSGPAGTGKTVVAIQIAQKAMQKGGRVLVIVPTKALRQFYNSILGNTSKMVVLHDAALALLSDEWDLILLDEAQDVPPSLMESVRLYCEEHDSSLLVIHDSNQRLVTQHAAILGRFTQAHFTKVLRSTSQIGELAARFYLNGNVPPDIAGPSGVPIEEISVQSSAGVAGAVSKFIADLVDREGFSFRDIVVLFGSSTGALLRDGGKIFNGVKFRNAANVWGEGCDDARCVACCGIKAFRGMESPVVILCEIDNLLDQQLIEGCYVGTSRAQHVLAIVGLPGTLNRIHSIDLNPVANERQKREIRTRERHRGVERVTGSVKPGVNCLGCVTGIQEYGIFLELLEFGCPALLPRREIRCDPNLDLSALYWNGREVDVVIRKIENGKVFVALPASGGSRRR